MEIGHLHILVEDVDVSKAFYLENFALTQVAEADFGVILRDDSGIDFVIGPADDSEVQGQRMHFGFRQESKSAVKEKFEELGARGQEFKTPYMENDFITLFSLLDPDDNLVEVYFANLA
jgi:catechol 2,3-dioxygenase-like lactoylglutathione lyase family enzyme